MISAHDFDPRADDSSERLRELFPDFTIEVVKKSPNALRVRFCGEGLLDVHSLGRLLLVNGKLRKDEITLFVQCSPAMARQLSDYGIHRVLMLNVGSEMESETA